MAGDPEQPWALIPSPGILPGAPASPASRHRPGWFPDLGELSLLTNTPAPRASAQLLVGTAAAAVLRLILCLASVPEPDGTAAGLQSDTWPARAKGPAVPHTHHLADPRLTQPLHLFPHRPLPAGIPLILWGPPAHQLCPHWCFCPQGFLPEPHQGELSPGLHAGPASMVRCLQGERRSR